MAKFRCEVCNIALPSAITRDAHFTGKKHQLSAMKLNARKEEADRSIYVTRFKSFCPELDLDNYFRRFGPVAEIYVDKAQQRYAIVTFAEKSSAERAIRQREQYLNGSLMCVQRRQLKNKKGESVHGTLHVGSSSARIDLHKVMSKLHMARDLEEQMIWLETMICLSPKDHQERAVICNSIQFAIRKFFPRCDMELYGSSRNTYGFLGCDLDIALDLAGDQRELAHGDGRRSSIKPQEIPSIEAVNRGQKTTEQLLQLPIEVILRFLQRVIRKYVAGSRMVRYIPSSRCPLVQFSLGYSGLSCDMSCGRKLVIYNTALLKLYGELDPRVHLLVITLRYWGKEHGFVGGLSCITSYAFTLMVIFFLQTLNLPLVPVVEDLIYLTEERRMVEGWECGFCSDIEKIKVKKTSKNQDSAGILLQQFFEYYSNFDFALHVACPRTGTVVPKTVMSQQPGVSAFKFGDMCIQDPFDLDHNLTKNITGQFLLKFIEGVAKALEICHDANFLMQNDFGCWGVMKLFSKESPHSLCLAEPLQLPTTKAQPGTTFEVGFTPTMLQPYLATGMAPLSDNAIKVTWLEKTCRFVIEVLQHALMMECTVENKERHTSGPEHPAKRICIRPEKDEALDVEMTDSNGPEQANVADLSNLPCHVFCKVYHRTWMNRKRTKQSYIPPDISKNPLDIEHYISEQIVQQHGETKGSEAQLLFEFVCQMECLQKGPRLSLGVTIQRSTPLSKEFKTVETFLQAFIPKVVEKCFAAEVIKTEDT